MIHFKIDEIRLSTELQKIFSELKGIPNKQNMANVSRAVGSIAAKEFVSSLNKTARSNPSQFHHLYEWGEVGRDSSRLVKAKRVASGTNVSVELIFKPSKKKVPVSEALLTPGKTGKSVVRRSVFKNKAEFIESGRSANWIAARNVVFMAHDSMGHGRMMFKRKGTVFNINNPGGRAAQGGLERYARKWESGMANAAIEKSRLFVKLEKDIAKTLSMPSVRSGDIRNCIKMVCDTYDAGTREF